jgi:polar amino acid transport system substrate-binding protein
MNQMTRRSLLALTTASLMTHALPAVAQDTLQARIDAGKVTVGIHNRRPWGFRDADGKVAGFHPDLVRTALAPLGITEINFVISDFGALIPGLQAKRIDMIASGISITPERCTQVIFSEPDLSVTDAIIVKKGNPKQVFSFDDIVENEDFVLGGGRGTLNTKNALAAGIPEDRVQQFPGTQEALSALMSGRVDGNVISGPTATMLLEDENLADKLERVTPFSGLMRDNGEPVALYTAIAFRPDDTELRDAYNARLAEMTADGTVAEIRNRYGFTDDEAAPSYSTADICAGL